MQTTRQHFLLLDGLRGVAAISVVWGHALVCTGRATPPGFELAVDFFYILSGFVVAHAYQARLATGMTWSSFARVRLIRLYPLMMLGALIGIGVAAFLLLRSADFAWWRLWASAALSLIALPSFLIPTSPLVFPMNSPSWSLSFEFVANFIYGALGPKLSQRVLIALTGFGAVALVATALWFGALTVGYQKTTILGGFARVGFGFLCGLAIHGCARMPRLRPRIGLLIACLLAFILLAPIPQPLSLQLALVIVAFPMMVQAAASVDLGPRASKISKLLGEASYPLYILHFPILQLITRAIERIDPSGHVKGAFLIVEVVACILVSYGALTLFDKPIRRWLSKPATPPATTEARVYAP